MTPAHRTPASGGSPDAELAPPIKVTFPGDSSHHAEAAALIARSRFFWGGDTPQVCRAADLTPERAPLNEGSPLDRVPRHRWHSVFFVHKDRMSCDLVRAPDADLAARIWMEGRDLPEEHILHITFRRDPIMIGHTGGHGWSRNPTGQWQITVQPSRLITALIWVRDDLCVELTGEVWPRRKL